MMPARRLNSLDVRALDGATTAEADHRSSLLRDLAELAGTLHEIDLVRDEADAERARTTASQLEVVLKRCVSILQVLERLDREPGDDDLRFDVEPATVDGIRVAVSALPRLSDLCFAALLDLNRATDALERACTLDELLVAAETALRKMRRAMRAVLEVAHEAGFGSLAAGEHLRQDEVFDLSSTTLVRPLYAKFRRGLRRAESEDGPGVLTALRYAAGALATLISSPDYGRARVSDRALLRRLQGRLLAWARSDKHTGRGLELLDDVWACAELLRGINRRQELRVHDAAVIQGLCAGVGTDSAAWLARVGPLYGLDDQLDALIDRAATGHSRPLLEEVRLRLLTLR